MLPNYPNPFNPETWLPFELDEASRVVVVIYDMQGRLVRTLELVTGMLKRRLPSLSTGTGVGPESPPTVLLIIDGLADRPVRELGNRTPLQAAKTPVFDRLAAEGRCGLADPVSPGVVPDTAAGSLALFGQSPLALKRGPVEALGAGLNLLAGDVALRGNFATIDGSGHVVDRRAGRIRDHAEELAKAIDRVSLPQHVSSQVEVRVKVGTEHRLAVVLRGDGLSADIHGSDPGEGTLPSEALTPRPADPNNKVDNNYHYNYQYNYHCFEIGLSKV